MRKVGVPQISSLETAIRLYYERVELSSKDIKELFGCSASTATGLKQAALEQMEKEDLPRWSQHNVNTEAAYRAWGLEIATLERNLRKLRALKLAQEPGTATEEG